MPQPPSRTYVALVALARLLIMVVFALVSLALVIAVTRAIQWLF